MEVKPIKWAVDISINWYPGVNAWATENGPHGYRN